MAALPMAAAAPASSASADGNVASWGEMFGLGRRNSAPDIYERSDDGWRNKRDSGLVQSKPAKPRMARRSMERVLRARQAGACLDSTYTEDDINTLLWQGGQDTKVQLCPGATLQLQGPIIYSARNQEISTQGYPTGSTRGKLQVTGDDQDVAIWMNCDQCIGTSIRNIEIDGARPALGWIGGGSCLVELGGNAYYQTVTRSNIHDPRGWCAVHVIEGWQDSCHSQVLTNNEVGPAGTSPNTAQQFHVVMKEFKDFIDTPPRVILERQTAAPGRWADGLSVACRNTTVSGNTIVGATDGGIVLFGSPGSRITGNTIIARGNTLLGGINMVDHGPYAGDYSGSTISGNTIISENAMIKIGIATGLMAWGSYNRTDYRTEGGTIQNNIFKSGGGSGYFGYGIAVGGHDNAIVAGNNFNAALFGGTRSYACDAGAVTPPFQAAIWSPYTTSGGSYQKGITSLVDFSFLICTMPCQYDSKCAATMKLSGPTPVADLATTSSTIAPTSSTLASTSTASTSSSTSSTTTRTSTSTSSSTASSTTKSSTTSSATTSKASLSLGRGRVSSTTASSSTAKAALANTTTKKANLAASSTTTSTPTVKLSLSRDRGSKRDIGQVGEQAAAPQQARRKRNADAVAELEDKLALYRDYILPGGLAVRTARPRPSFLEQDHGFDKRDVLADSAYWEN